MMNKYERPLPEIFETFSDQRRQSFIAAKEYKDNGGHLVGMYCTYMPMELVFAAGATAISLCAASEETIPDAEEDLPRNLCPLIKASYGFGKMDKCPYFYFSDLVVGENTCDGKKKMYEYLSEIKPMHIMDLPNTQSEDGLKLFKEELYKFKDKLEEIFEVEITDEKLRAACAMRNRERRAHREFFETMQMDPPPMMGLDCFKVTNGANFRFDREKAVEEMEDMTRRLREQGSLPEKRPRILVTGSPLDGVAAKVLTALESNGAYGVAFESCSGMKPLYGTIDENAEDIYEAIARYYLNIGCSCMSPNPNRRELLTKMCRDYKVDGVVEVVLQACHTYAVESRSVRRLVTEELGLPYMALETDYSKADEGQLTTRLSAFVEML